MKRSPFSGHLYREGLRQLRVVGLIFAFVSALIVIATPILDYFSFMTNPEMNHMLVTYQDHMNPMVIFSFCLIAPLFTLILFSFLNHRESSDFYHAVPYTRTTLFFSYMAAIVTWVAIILVSSGVLSVAAYACFPQAYTVNLLSVLQVTLNCFVGSLLIIASVGIGMAVTGTTFNNVLVSLLLIFMPRMLLDLVITVVTSSFPLLDGLPIFPILDADYNIPVGFVMDLFSFGDCQAPLLQLSSTAYTLVLAVIYFVIAWRLFVHRPSESAAQGAPSRRLQAVFRFAVGFAVSSVTTVSLYESDGYIEEIAAAAVGYLFAVILMLVYELLTNRRRRGAVGRTALSIPWLIGANIALFALTFGLGTAVKNYTPTAEQITSVRLLSDGYDSERTDYFASRADRVKLTDPTVLSLVADRLNYSATLCNDGWNRYYEERDRCGELCVAIASGGREHYRRLLMTEKDTAALNAAVIKNAEYQAIYRDLPTEISGADYLYTNTADARRLYQIFYDEFNTLSMEQRYQLFSHNDDFFYDGKAAWDGVEDNNGYLATVEFYLPSGTAWEYLNVPIDTHYLPKTAAEYIRQWNTNGGAVGTTVPSKFTEDDMLTLTFRNCDGRNTEIYLQGEQMAENSAALRDWLLSLDETAPVDITRPFVLVSLDVMEQTEFAYHSASHYYPISEFPAFLAEFVEFIE